MDMRIRRTEKTTKPPIPQMGQLFQFVFVGLLASLLLLSTVGRPVTYGTPCRPDNRFDVSGEEYNAWAPSDPFEVTIAFGNMPFWTAKLVDVVWDVGFGKGGQLVLAYASYRILVRYMVSQMTIAPISVAVYKRVTLESEPSLVSAIGLAWDFYRYGKYHSTLGMCWTMTSIIFVLVFPILSASMTSYKPTTAPYLSSSGDYWTPIATIDRVDFVIRDERLLAMYNIGSHLTYNVTTLAAWSPHSFEERVNCTAQDLRCQFERNYHTPIYSDISAYISKFGFRSRLDQPSSVHFNGTMIDFTAPTLNIDAHYLAAKTSNGHDWQDPKTGEFPFQNPENARFVINKQVLDLRELETRAQCQSRGVTTYEWGFSFLLLFIFIVLTLLWLVLSSRIYRQSQLIAGGQDLLQGFGSYTALVKVALCLQHGLGLPLEHVAEMSEKMIRESIGEGLMKVQHKVKLEPGDDHATDSTEEEVA